MEIEHECKALSSAFAYHLDRREYQKLADLFAPDGVWIRHYVPLRGREAILAAMAERPSTQFTRHVTTGFHFTEVTETRASAVSINMSYFSFQAETLPAPYEPEKAMLLDFVDTYIKTEAGWRFLERDTRMVLIPKEVQMMDSHSR
jgi:hypothetical protein